MSDLQNGKRIKKHGKQKGTRDKKIAESHTHSLTSLSTNSASGMVPSTGYPIQQQTPAKIAIPRLRRDSDGQLASGANIADKSRVTHACESCRTRKTKCSGDRPICKHCEDFGLECIYGEGKRDRAKKQFKYMSRRLDDYERLLKELSLGANNETQTRIARVLERDASPDYEPNSPASPDDSTSQRSGPAENSLSQYGENVFTARVGSIDSLDTITEDFNRDATSRATGYHGKNSDVTWLQRLRQRTEVLEDDMDTELHTGAEANHSRPGAGRRLSSGLTAISDSTYHCDDLSVFLPDQQVDPYERPPKQIADALFQSYLETIHPAFPIIGQVTFSQQYRSYFSSQLSPNDNWLAILNLIFAIGAKYAHLIKADWRGDERDHLIYFTRARMLGFNSDSILGHADLQRVQVCGLMAFYLMACNQVNRAWGISGIAIRHASTLGLNLKNDSPDVPQFSKEIRYRVWWALYSLEHQLAMMTGRQTLFSDADCSAPLPLPVDENNIANGSLVRRWSNQGSQQNQGSTPSLSSAKSTRAVLSPTRSISSKPPQMSLGGIPNATANSGLYFLHQTKLDMLTNEALGRLYRAGAVERTWAQTQSAMADLDAKMTKWQNNLPMILDFTVGTQDQQWARQRNTLGFSFYSTKLIINRPCLCRIDRKIVNESSKAREFDQASAAKCVRAACNMLGLLPNEPNRVFVYTRCPWWCLVHDLVGAAVVCMLELSFRSEHMPNEVDEVFQAAEKALRWLQSMSSQDLAASRAAFLCNEMLKRVAPKVGRSVEDSSSLIPDPHNVLQNMQSHVQEASFKQSPFSYQTSAPFQPPVFTSYDQWSQNRFLQNPPQTILPNPTNGPFPSFFPTSDDMDAEFDQPVLDPRNFFDQ